MVRDVGRRSCVTRASAPLSHAAAHNRRVPNSADERRERRRHDAAYERHPCARTHARTHAPLDGAGVSLSHTRCVAANPSSSTGLASSAPARSTLDGSWTHNEEVYIPARAYPWSRAPWCLTLCHRWGSPPSSCRPPAAAGSCPAGPGASARPFVRPHSPALGSPRAAPRPARPRTHLDDVQRGCRDLGGRGGVER